MSCPGAQGKRTRNDRTKRTLSGSGSRPERAGRPRVPEKFGRPGAASPQSASSPHLCRPQSPDLPSLFGTVRSAWAPEAARTGLSQAALGLRAPPRLPRPPSGEEPPYPEAQGARGSAPTPAASQVWVFPIYWKRRRLAAVDKTQTHWKKITSFHQFQTSPQEEERVKRRRQCLCNSAER